MTLLSMDSSQDLLTPNYLPPHTKCIAELIAASRISNAVQELDLEARLLLSDEATNSEAGKF